ncbi:hypothetical protein DPMN_165562 [Dreissena polymorpha]|uniref:Fibrinogen C-terminal domain-containing protein n=1 Tax=Dreissena polymorpha TaxID=45954 RepID=A0A9D4EXU6_DREPO|nr:hypothetical protein DPMN_165562 [Dreissena polymorpha]
MKLAGFVLLFCFGIVFHGILCFPEPRSNAILSDIERKIDDLRNDLMGEVVDKRNVIATLVDALIRLIENNAKESMRQKPIVFLNTASLDKHWYIPIDITSVNDSAIMQFRNKTEKLNQNLLSQIKQMEDFYSQKLLSESADKGTKYNKSSLQINTIIHNINRSIDSFTSHMTDYISRLQSENSAFQRVCNTFEAGNEVKNKRISCQDVKESGVYTIYPDFKPSGLQVYCEVDREKAWLIIQRRKDGTVDFDRTWNEYKAGFGDVRGEFWLGNEYIHHLTKDKPRQLRIDMETFEKTRKYAMYNEFSVTSEAQKYRLNIDGFSGDVIDHLKYHQGQMFSTYDSDNDSNRGCCACSYHAGWWFNGCHNVNINGKYYYKHESVPSHHGVYWEGFTGSTESLKTVESKIH